MMNKLATIVALSALTCTTTATEAESAGGETAATKVEVSGYGGVYILDVARSIDQAGPGLGGGVDVVFGPLSLGVEGGMLGYSGYFSTGGSLRFRRDAQWSPFVRLGWTLISSDSPFLVNVGGGVRYRLGDRTVLIFEVRDYIFIDDPSHHVAGARIGLSFSFP